MIDVHIYELQRMESNHSTLSRTYSFILANFSHMKNLGMYHYFLHIEATISSWAIAIHRKLLHRTATSKLNSMDVDTTTAMESNAMVDNEHKAH